MRLNVVFISGPRHCGKSALVHLMASRLCDRPPHYVRLVPVGSPGDMRKTLLGELKDIELASRTRVNYDVERIYEYLPECLNQIAALRQSPTVLVEADADSNLRYAYPYDQRIFAMQAPERIEDVFRSAEQATRALREVMDDTAAFASEMFGMFDPSAEEDDGVKVQTLRDRQGVTEERIEVNGVQLRRFMNSPLGAEVASRIQLQPDYHSLMESDIIVVNMGIGGVGETVDQCNRQIQTMIDRLADGRMSRPLLFACDPFDFSDPLQYQFIKRLRHICNDPLD